MDGRAVGDLIPCQSEPLIASYLAVGFCSLFYRRITDFLFFFSPSFSFAIPESFSTVIIIHVCLGRCSLPPNLCVGRMTPIAEPKGKRFEMWSSELIDSHPARPPT